MLLGAFTLGADAASDREATQQALEPPQCGPGSRPEPGIDGRAPAGDFESGRAFRGDSCNTRLVGHVGSSAGFKVERYRDSAGHVCAFYDVSRMFPT